MSEVWRMLGEAHAENDEDRVAIACLEKAVDIDPYNLDALLVADHMTHSMFMNYLRHHSFTAHFGRIGFGGELRERVRQRPSTS